MRYFLGVVMLVGSVGGALAQEYNWSGLYLGGHVGYAHGNMSVVDTDGGVPYGAFKYSPAGVVAGGTVGYNRQIGDRFLVGIEGDLGYLELNGSKYIASDSPKQHQDLSVDGGLYGDITGRLGFTLGRTLIYGKTGYAFFDGEALQQTTKTWYTATGTDTFTGWVYGGGAEFALSPQWSVKLEYLRFDFGSQGGVQEKTSTVGEDDPYTPKGYKFHNDHDLTVDTVKLGVNYHFGGREEPIGPLK